MELGWGGALSLIFIHFMTLALKLIFGCFIFLGPPSDGARVNKFKLTPTQDRVKIYNHLKQKN